MKTLADFYKTLNVDPKSSKQKIKKAFREKAKITHPDAGGNLEEFKEIVEAHELLTNDELMKEFERTGKVNTKESESERNKNKAVESFIQMFEQVFFQNIENFENVKLILIIINNFNNQLTKLNEDLEKGKDQIIRLKKVKTLISRRDGKKKENYIVNYCNQSIQAINKSVAEVKLEILHIKRVIKIANQFQWKRENGQTTMVKYRLSSSSTW
jgi:DnaJ-class molecular chaperone